MGKRVKLRFHFQGSAQRRAFFVSFSSQTVALTHHSVSKTKRGSIKTTACPFNLPATKFLDTQIISLSLHLQIYCTHGCTLFS